MDDLTMAGPPSMSRAAFVTELALSPAHAEAGRMFDTLAIEGIRPEVALAFFHVESKYGTKGVAHDYQTRSIGNVRTPEYPALASGVVQVPGKGQYAKYPTWVFGVADWCKRLKGPKYAGAGLLTVRQVLPVYAPKSDHNDPVHYGDTVIRMAREFGVREEETMAVSTATTDRMIRDLRARGVEIIDKRGAYGTYPQRNRGAYIGVHWSGDPQGRIVSPANTLAQDLYRTERYRAYHMEEGHGWPGIAYPVLCYPSGRVIVAHDLDRLTYHAYNANDDAVAVCCPLSDGAQPSAAQARALHHVLDWLCFDCPELGAGAAQVFGHNELAFLDARNADTKCPGTLLPLVRSYRGRTERAIPIGGGTVVKEPIAGSPSGSPHARIIAEMQLRLTPPQLGAVQGQGWVEVDGREYPLVEFEKGRFVLIGAEPESMFVDPANPYSFAALDAAGKVRWG